MTRLHLILLAGLFILAVRPAPAQTWVGAIDQNWNRPNNWLPSTIPNSANAVVTFGNAGVGAVNIASSVQADVLNFTNVGTGSFTLTSSASQTLSGLSAINLTGNDSGTQTINLAYQADGNLLFGAAGTATSLTITNNPGIFGSSTPNLLIGPNTVIGTPGGGGVVVTGYGTTTLSGSFANFGSANNVDGGLTNIGPGQLIFSGDGTLLQGGLTLNGGTLTLDYTTNAASKLGSGALTLSGGSLSLSANATAVTQSVNSTTFAAYHTFIAASANTYGTNVTLNLGAITRSPGATVDFAPYSSNAVLSVLTSTGNTNGLLGIGPAYATMASGSTWATNSGGTVIGLPDSSYSANYASGNNTDYVGGTTSLTSNTKTNSIRFNASTSNELDLYNNLNLTLQSGGILVTSNSGPVLIQGFFGGAYATITTPGGGAGELLVHQYSYNNLTIDAAIATSGGLTTSGYGTVVLGGSNTGLTGPINVNLGSLTVTQTAAVNSASTININGNSLTGINQYLSVQLGNGVNGTVSTNIGLVSSALIVYMNTGTSAKSTVTLSGVISSVQGQATYIGFGYGQDISSGINVTGNNTYLGAAYLYGGTLGINSNASLGNAANTLYLQVGSSTAGGLEFLNGGINVAQSVVLSSSTPTRIVSNGSDVNTISGVISGDGRLFKAGFGTLILSGTNTYSGGTEIDAGTLSVGVDANFGSIVTPVSINTGATLAVSGSLLTNRPLLIGPISTAVPNGPANINVAAGQTLTLTGGIQDNLGPGTLVLTGPGTVALSTPNSYSGGTVVQQGALIVAIDSDLGSPLGPVTVDALGALTFTATTTTARGFTLNFGTLGVAAGKTLTLNGASVGGGFLTGPGAVAMTGGSVLAGVTTQGSLAINQTGTASYINVTNGSTLSIGSGLTATMTGFTNQGSGSITVGAVSVVNAAEFQSYGTLTLKPATMGSGQFTEVVNTGTSPMYFNGGSETFIGTAATAINPMTGQPADLAGINLNGQNAVVAGGLFVNNGFVADGGASGTATIIADFGSLVKGAGFFQNSVITQNGGKFQAGNSPGSATFGNFVLGPGGVNSYVFAIDDATGTAGPHQNAAGQVSGWGLVNAVRQQMGSTTTPGNFTWTADPADKLTVALDTLVNPTVVGTDVAGPMADFDPTRAYSWLAAQWAGTYSGPTDAASLNADTAFDTSGFVNPINGTFGWSLDPADQTLSLTYTPTPVPEPGTLALVGLAAAGLAGWRRRGQPTCRPHSDQA